MRLPPRALDAAGQARDEITHRAHGLVRRLALMQRMGHGVDQHGADHDTIGMLADIGRILGGLDAEADGDRQVGVALDAGSTASPTAPRDLMAAPVMPVIET